MKSKNNNMKCKICKRTLTEKSKTGLCPDCLNKYGTPAAGVGIGAAALGIKQAVKHKDAIGKGVKTVGKALISLIKR